MYIVIARYSDCTNDTYRGQSVQRLVPNLLSYISTEHYRDLCQNLTAKLLQKLKEATFYPETVYC